MNYRHAFHAGNFADVHKHLLLTWTILRLQGKPAPIRVIDTHGGVGLYDLAAGAADRTKEWKSGIGRLIGPAAEPIPAHAEVWLRDYLAPVRALNPEGQLIRYPGSPWLAQRLLRESDRLVVNELHPEDHAELARLFHRDENVRVLNLDAYVALKSLLPPKERRGIVLIDPPYESPDEVARLLKGLGEALKRFATGVFLIWYPIKDDGLPLALKRGIVRLAPKSAVASEIFVRKPSDSSPLAGSGVILLSPPFKLAEVAVPALDWLAQRLRLEGEAERHVWDWLIPER